MVGVWHGTPYQVASVSSTADGVIVASGSTGTHTTHPKTGHRHTKDPSSGTSTWHEQQVLSDVTLAQPLQVIAFSGAVGVREADDAVIVVTKQAATAPRLFRRYAPNVLMWTVSSDKA